MTLATAALVAAMGALIGAVGLGGFLMVPVLLHFEPVSVREAVVVAAIAFLASGVVSLALSRRDAGTRGRLVALWPFLLAAAPGAALGALLVGRLHDRVLALVIAAAFVVAALGEWLERPRTGAERNVPKAVQGGGGAAAGFASALTGTSGPMVAIPLLAVAGVPIRERVAVAQVVQIPIAVAATLAFVSVGDVRWHLALWASASLCVGMVLGVRVAPALSVRGLRRVAAVLMLGAAAAMVVGTRA